MMSDNATGSDLADIYTTAARMLSYPNAELTANLLLAKDLIQRARPNESAVLEGFANEVSKLGPAALEELYVTTFDVNPACCLDVGYAIFGEDYKRGQCMAELKCLHQKYGIDCGTELPDHLPNVLKLLPCLPYGDAAELVREVVAPAVKKMGDGFGAMENPYRHMLTLVGDILRLDYLVQ